MKMNKPDISCCNGNSRLTKHQRWVTGEIETPSGKIPMTGTQLTLRDKIDAVKIRFAIGRMNYGIEPGLYAIGNPTPASPVFVTANYKLSFDVLRSALTDIDSWLLILDTKGINVWCAAGKGTFSTEEIVNRVKQTQLNQIVTHRKLIVPQLGAPGVSAIEVNKLCGFQLIYGPVRAQDLPDFVKAEFKATSSMRKVQFTVIDRIAVIPVELIIWFKQALGLAILLALLDGIHRSGFNLANAPRTAGLVFIGWLTGGILVPILLPWLPGRAFSVKGLWAALLLWSSLCGCKILGDSIPYVIGWGLLLITIVSFMALNFTGATTYTSMSGVKKEMRIAMPLQLITAITGIVLILIGDFK